MNKKQLIRTLLIALFPILIFYVVEKYTSVKWAVIAGVAFGLLECSYEYIKYKKIEVATLAITSLIIVMGALSLYTGSGIFYKLNPAVYESIFAVLFIITTFTKTPLMLIFAKKQMGSEQVEKLSNSFFKWFNFRIGVFFLIHAILTIYSALYLSTAAWAFIKGVLFYVMMAAYMGLEIAYKYLRFRQFKKLQHQAMINYATLQRMKPRTPPPSP